MTTLWAASPEVVTHYSFGGATVGFRHDTGATSTRHYLVSDHLGTNAAQYAQSDPLGTVTRQYHLPYGGYRGASGNQLATDRTYTGQIDDQGIGTGLMFYNARYYDPLLRRFISADTIIPNPAESQDHNRYMYVRGNPVRFNDPTGHNPAVRSRLSEHRHALQLARPFGGQSWPVLGS